MVRDVGNGENDWNCEAWQNSTGNGGNGEQCGTFVAFVELGQTWWDLVSRGEAFGNL